MRFIIALALGLGLSGCLVPGNSAILNDALIAEIKCGQSTRADVEARFGKPAEIQSNMHGTTKETALVYFYQRRGSYELVPAIRERFSRPGIYRTMKVSVGDDGVVKDLQVETKEVHEPTLLLVP